MDHLFRRESGKMVSSLTRFFGAKHLELAEDVVQETLLKAVHEWPFKGVPKNPSAWLFSVAKNMVIDELRRNSRHAQLLKEEQALLRSEWTLSTTVEQALNPESIQDDTLRMIFACCHPALPREQQAALALRTLCGFSVPEIARAFLSKEDTINKRLFRARATFKKIGALEIPANSELDERLGNVLEVIYLLFNEGYLSTDHTHLIREDLIEEALRLGQMLCDHPSISKPQVHALLALMIFHAARTPARVGLNGEVVLLAEQDRSKWDKELIKLGLYHLQRSADSVSFSKYHGQAAIAFLHMNAPSVAETDWLSILSVYDQLLLHDPSDIVRLNRAVAIGYAHDASRALKTLDGIEGLNEHYLYHSVRAAFLVQLSKYTEARQAYREALDRCSSKSERDLLAKKLAEIHTE